MLCGGPLVSTGSRSGLGRVALHGFRGGRGYCYTERKEEMEKVKLGTHGIRGKLCPHGHVILVL